MSRTLCKLSCHLVTLLTFMLSTTLSAQISLSLVTGKNHVCNGCNYAGGSILINEVMIRPLDGDGCIFGTYSGGPCQGEWIELYNPDSCCPVDISCYFLGNNAEDGDPLEYYPGGFELPPGCIVPPAGFVVVRGDNAPSVPPNLLVQNGGRTIEIVVTGDNNVCFGGGTRLWFPNAGGWFAFYDASGIPQDAICWNDLNNFDPNAEACNPPHACPYTGALCSFYQIPPEKMTFIADQPPLPGLSFRRMPDGGNWQFNYQDVATMGTYNMSGPLFNQCDGYMTATPLSGTPPFTYHWNDCFQQSTPTAIHLCAGLYCVTVSDSQGNTGFACASVFDSIIEVTMSALPVVCESDSPFSLSGGNPQGGTYSGPGVVNNLFNPQLSGPGTHLINYKYASGQACIDSAQQFLTVLYAPEVSASTNTPFFCEPDTIFLLGTAIGGNPGYDALWRGPSGFTSASWTPLILNSTTAQSGFYYFTVQDQNHCKGADSVYISVYPRPVLDVFPRDTAVCRDSLITLRASGAEFYQWYGNGDIILGTDSTLVVAPHQNSLYHLVGSNHYGCDATAASMVYVYKAAGLNFPDTLYLCIGEQAFLNANGDDSVSFTWQDGSHKDYFIVNETGDYWVRAESRGCRESDTCRVLPCSLIFVPDAFTPNGDLTNDEFGPAVNIGLRDFEFYIFNRWGENIFSTKDYLQSWDGRYKGEICKQDLYLWVIFYTPLEGGKQRLQGYVMLLR